MSYFTSLDTHAYAVASRAVCLHFETGGMLASDCTTCTAGFVCGPACTTPLPCGSESQYCPSGASQPLPVSLGYFVTGVVGQRSGQAVCPLGSYCTGDGSAKLCGYGVYGGSTGACRCCGHHVTRKRQRKYGCVPLDPYLWQACPRLHARGRVVTASCVPMAQ